MDCNLNLSPSIFLVGEGAWRVRSLQGQPEVWLPGVCLDSEARGLPEDDGVRPTDTGQR